MTGSALVLLVTVVVIGLLVSVALRPRRRRLANRGRRPAGFRRRRMDAIKRAAADDVAMIQGNDRFLGRNAGRDRKSRL